MDGKKVKISASVMCADWMHLENDIRILEEEKIDFIHYDVMDGFFAPDYCLGTNIINIIRRNTHIPADYHLMVEEPSRILNNFEPEDSGILTIHYEACRNLHRDLMKIKHMGFKVGLALNPATPLNAIEYVAEEVDYVTVMTVNPGYAGQKLVPQTLKKIEALFNWREGHSLNFQICVDGNVDCENVPKMVAAGCDILVGGSSGLFVNANNLTESISALRRHIREGLEKRGIKE